MRRLALQSLLHDRGKLVASFVGVTFAGVLVFTQLGLLAGYVYSFLGITHFVGGDVWVMSRGAESLDYAEPLSVGSRAAAARHPCVAAVRPLIFAEGSLRKPSGMPQIVRLIAAEPPPSGGLLPWNTAFGGPADLRAPLRISVEMIDREKLQLPEDPIGARVEIGGQSATVAVLSRGIRSGSTFPFIFADPPTARRLARLPDGATTFWLVDLHQPSCAGEVIAEIERSPGLMAMTRAQATAMTGKYWLETTGVGAALTFVAVMGLIVGTVIVGQTLYAMVRDRERELATLRALGATARELAAFVAWQAGILAVVGITLGYGASAVLRDLARTSRLMIVLPPSSAALGVGLLVAMCCAASALGIRRVVKLDPAIVFA
jgi:putative ABC transport system permease protein